MKTDVLLKDGQTLRAHFSYLREDHVAQNPKEAFSEQDFESAVTDAVLQAFDFGQIDNYDNRNIHDYPYFESVLNSKAITVCELTFPKKDEITGLHKLIATGFAFCSRKDQFNKTIGRRIAFARALEDLTKIGYEIESVTTFSNKK